jgi:CHAT domain-containing protein
MHSKGAEGFSASFCLLPRSAFLVLVTLLACACTDTEPLHNADAQATAPPTAPRTAVGQPSAEALAPVELDLTEEVTVSSGNHRFRVSLAAGDLLHLVITAEDPSADLVAILADSEGEIRFDSLAVENPPEEVFWIADSPGPVYLRDEDQRGAPLASYSIVRVAHRPATDRDRALFGAEQTLATAHRLRRTGDESSCNEAVTQYEAALRKLKPLGTVARQLETHFGLALTWLHCLSVPERALEAFSQAAALAEPASRTRAFFQNHCGGLLHDSRRLDEARSALREAAEISAGLGDVHQEALARARLAIVLEELDELGLARQQYGWAAELWRQLGKSCEEQRVLLNRGVLLRDLGEVSSALADLEQALRLCREKGDPNADSNRAAALTALAGMVDDHERALDLLQEARSLRVKGDPGEAITLSAQGLVLRRLRRFSEAKQAYEAALESFRQLGRPRDQALTLHNLGWLEIFQEQPQPDAARRYFSEALQLFQRYEELASEVDTRLGLAMAQRLDGLPELARETERKALDSIEQRRVRVAASAARTGFFSTQQDHYDFYIDLLVELAGESGEARYAAEGFAVSERARARALYEAVAGAGANVRPGTDAALAAQVAEKDREIAKIERQLQSLDRQQAPAADTRKHLRGRWQELAREREELIAQMPEDRFFPEEPLTALAVQRTILDPDTLLLQFHLGHDRATVWTVSTDALTVHDLGPSPAIEAAASEVLPLLADSRGWRSNSRAIQRRMTVLARLLLQPLGNLGRYGRLAIVADGSLHYLPFALLPSPGNPEELLIDRKEIVYLPSASALAALRRRAAEHPERKGERWEGSALVLADPVFSRCDPRVEGAPCEQAEPVRYRRLSFSRQEAERILALSATGSESLRLFDFDASRGALLQSNLDKYAYLHFATHAEVADVNPGSSRLVLSRVDRHGRPLVRGSLDLADVYELQLNAEMVTLSACRTALGEEVRGEGLIGLTHGFFQSGAKRVVVSLWPANDRRTAELMERFYAGIWRNGLTPAQALRAAQLSLRADPATAAPYYWAGFVLQGDWR